MKTLRLGLLCLLLVPALASCGPKPTEGPMGIHVGDVVGGATVKAVGKDWVEFPGGRVHHEDELKGVNVKCPHD